MSDARGEFFALVNHELRSPLTTILGYQELLAEGVYGDLDERSGEPIARIGRAAQYLLRLMDGVIELSEFADEAPPLEPAAIDLDALVGAGLEVLRAEAAERNLDLDIHIEEPLGRMTTDSERLLRVLDLALTSAARHAAAKTLDVRGRRDGDRLELRVEGTDLPAVDSGPGREGEEDDDATIVRLGLRLAIARRTARRLQGRLRLTGDDGATSLQLTIRPLAAGPDPEV